MRQDVPDVNLTPVVVDGRDESGLVPANIENSELADFVRMREHGADLLDIGKTADLQLFKPLDKTRRAVRVQLGKLVEPFARDDVHCEPEIAALQATEMRARPLKCTARAP